MKAVSPIWHEFSLQLNYDNGLEPHFAAASVVAESGGSRSSEFTASGETWVARLYYQESGIVHPGSVLPTGTPFDLETMREYRIAIFRHPDEDSVGQQKMNAHLRPRWRGMEVESADGTRRTLDLPDGIDEGMNVRLSGSNIDATRYQPILRAAAGALDLNPGHFRDAHDSSSVQDGERYVRLHRDATGPIHARDGPIAQLGHLLEHDREGYRKVVQNDDDRHGKNLPGFYHTATLGPERVREAFPSHAAPVEIKHYYAREALAQAADHPLAHPKVGVSYQVNRWDGKIGVSPDDIQALQDELDETLHAVLADSGVTLTPADGDGGGPYVPDAYFPAEIGEHQQPPKLNLTRIRNEQENIVVRTLTATGGLSPVEQEALETLVTDGGKPSPADIADHHGRHVGSVRRALRRLDELVEREYGGVSLRSNYVAEMVHESVQTMQEASDTLAEATGQALLAAERGLDDTVSALRTWCAKHGVEVESRGEAIEAIRLGEVDRVGRYGFGRVNTILRRGLELWTDSGRDAESFRAASVNWKCPKRGPRTLPVNHARLLG